MDTLSYDGLGVERMGISGGFQEFQKAMVLFEGI